MPEIVSPQTNAITVFDPDWEYGPIADDWSNSTQELLDAMPQRWSRSLLYTMVMFSSVALPWAFLAQVDEVGTARGRLEPKGKTIRLDAPVSGTVARVNVKIGQTVKAGEPLLALDTQLLQTELQQANDRLEGQRNRLVQLQLIQRQLDMSLRTQRLQYEAQIAEQSAEQNRAIQRIHYFRKSLLLSQQILQKDAQRAVKFRRLFEQGIIAGVRAEDAEREMLTTDQSMKQVQSELAQAEVDLQKQRSTAERIRREGEIALLATARQYKQSQAEITQLQTEMAALRSQIKNLTLQIQQSRLKIPVSGTIFELPQQHAGAVVQPGQMLATIAPKARHWYYGPRFVPLIVDLSKSGCQSKSSLMRFPSRNMALCQEKSVGLRPTRSCPKKKRGSLRAAAKQCLMWKLNWSARL